MARGYPSREDMSAQAMCATRFISRKSQARASKQKTSKPLLRLTASGLGCSTGIILHARKLLYARNPYQL